MSRMNASSNLTATPVSKVLTDSTPNEKAAADIVAEQETVKSFRIRSLLSLRSAESAANVHYVQLS